VGVVLAPPSDVPLRGYSVARAEGTSVEGPPRPPNGTRNLRRKSTELEFSKKPPPPPEAPPRDLTALGTYVGNRPNSNFRKIPPQPNVCPPPRPPLETRRGSAPPAYPSYHLRGRTRPPAWGGYVQVRPPATGQNIVLTFPKNFSTIGGLRTAYESPTARQHCRGQRRSRLRGASFPAGSRPGRVAFAVAGPRRSDPSRTPSGTRCTPHTPSRVYDTHTRIHTHR
jgi:hypothetical protein